ncbi:MAG TPA: hypothetical protein VED40_13840 [Azospirillaceae bacterium]|nr:hypothetical protein [Azospirillaceae bacterium]
MDLMQSALLPVERPKGRAASRGRLIELPLVKAREPQRRAPVLPAEPPRQASLAGARIHLVGQPHAMLPHRLGEAVRDRGARLVRALGPRVTLVCVAASALELLRGGALLAALPLCIPPGAEIIGEGELMRRLGLAPPPPRENRTFDADAFHRLSGLCAEAVMWLVIFDVLQPVDGRFGFRDLVAGRRVRDYLAQGVQLADVVAAALRLRRETGAGLADTGAARLPALPRRDMLGRWLDTDGQYLLPLDPAPTACAPLLAFAEQMRRHGAVDLAERALRTATRLAPHEPMAPYRLGELLASAGRTAEAALHWRMALQREPAFADAAVALARLEARRGREGAAVELLCGTLRRRPADPQLRSALATLLQRRGRHREALGFWAGVLDGGATGRLRRRARRQSSVCRKLAGAR